MRIIAQKDGSATVHCPRCGALVVGLGVAHERAAGPTALAQAGARHREGCPVVDHRLRILVPLVVVGRGIDGKWGPLL
jgi:hypothetical protein